jgi:hypothetical protein
MLSSSFGCSLVGNHVVKRPVMGSFLKLGLIVPLALALAAPAANQSMREHTLGGRALSPSAGVVRKVTSTEGSADARAVVQRIISVIGIPMTNFEVRASPGVANAEATTENGGKDRLIL